MMLMKQLLFTLLLTGTAMLASAQIRQGQFMVGGTAAFLNSQYANDGGANTTIIQLNPNAGYFFIDNLAGGVRVEFASMKTKDADAATTSFLAAPFVRYYFLPSAQKVNLFLDGSYGFGAMGSNDKQELNSYAFSAGPAIFLTRNTALEFSLLFRSEGGNAIGPNRLNTFGLNVGFQIHLGKPKAEVVK